MDTAFHEFANGLKIYRLHLGAERIARYTAPGAINLHEPVEEEWFLTVLKEIPAQKSAVIVDVGAAMGYYALLALLKRPDSTVICIEPQEEFCSWITENVALNGIDPTALMIHNAALAPDDGERLIIDNSYGSSLFPLTETDQHASYQRTYYRGALDVRQRKASTCRLKPVRCISIDTLLASADSSLDIVKIDVQGMEAAIIASLHDAIVAGRIRRLIVGTHSRELHLDCLHELEPLGEVLFDDPAPRQQPDGLIVFRTAIR